MPLPGLTPLAIDYHSFSSQVLLREVILHYPSSFLPVKY
jgi:hypothetical protein